MALVPFSIKSGYILFIYYLYVIINLRSNNSMTIFIHMSFANMYIV